uniref:Uncharacterized protein n=1 Tax=Branchiostoma floridae TaxID=7739 RepID=C3Y2P6_BRAFL|eukprot:XP_002609298.1 hypothetical protein BRAFLDRAFT_86790 [Branchiostoma floridae]
MLPDSPTTSGSTLHRHRRSKHVQAEDADRRFALVPAPRDGRSGTPKGPRGFSGIAGSVYGGRCLVPRKGQGWSAASSLGLVVGPPEKNPSSHLVMTHHMTSKGQASIADDSSNPWQTTLPEYITTYLLDFGLSI